MGTHWECLDYCLFVSIMSWVLTGVSCQLSICLHYAMGTHWECLVNCLFVSIMPWVLIGVSCQLSICLHYVMDTHWECLVNCLFVSIMQWVLIGSVLTTVYLSPLCHENSLGVSFQSSICLHDVKDTHWGCIVNRIFVSMMSRILIGGVLSIVNLSP